MMVAPGEGGDALELLLQRLDDDLLGVVDVVDDQAELPVVGLQDDDVDLACPPGHAVDLQLPGQVDQRQEVAAQPVDRAPWIEFDAACWTCSPSSRTSSSRLTCGMA